MSATPRFWQSTSYEFPSAAPTVASTPSDLASIRQGPTAFPRMSPSPVLTAASLRHLPQQQVQVPSQRSSPALSAAVPAALATLREPSPVVSAPATPVLFAKELPLAPPQPQPQTPSNTSSALPGSSTASSTPLLHPSVPLGSHVVQQDMYHQQQQQRPLLYRHAHSHSRSDSISSTNNVFSPTSLVSSASNLSPSITTTALSPATPHSRRTSLIATFTPSAVSAPMSPSSSYGLPSPTFPPRPLPTSDTYFQPPARPPRSPARPDRSGISALTSIPPSPSPSNAQPFSQYSAPIPRTNNTAGTTVNGMGSMSRRNSRQVSVRLSAAFNAPPSMSGASSRATSRAPSAMGGYGVDSFQYSSRGSAGGNNGSEIEVLREGDIVGPGCFLRNELVRAKSPGAESRRYEVVKKLGTGSYAVVYQVREILPPLLPTPTTTAASYSPARPPQPVINEDVFDEEDVFGGFSSHSLAQAPSSLALALGPRRTSAPGRRRSSLLGPSPSPFTPATSSPSSPSAPVRYGSSFAIKVLSKASLSPDELAVQATEVTIHASLPAHPNIVTLHAAMETVDWLLLVLEYVPGEDLYYFLEQQREGGAGTLEYEDDGSMYGGSSSGSSRRNSVFEDSDDDEEETRGRRRHRHRRIREPRAQDSAIGGDDVDGAVGTGGTPPTPSLLSSVHPAHMLSYGRLKLIASMFGQMCDAVQTCHSQGISHRDIKPENFIVTNEDTSNSALAKTGKKKVIVKLSDFGLATTERFSADVDCGSAPYMSYECRNAVGPTYATQPADVWSLGIVLINMLYHHNLWHDTFLGDASFEAFRAAPIAFLMQRSPGMTYDVAEFLANRVFRVLPDAPPENAPAAVKAQYEAEVESVRVSAGEFGEWARNLPALFYAPGSGANPLASDAPVMATSEAIASKRSSLISLAEARSVPHSPACVFGQLQAAAAAQEVDDDEEDEEDAEFAEKTFTQADASRSSFHEDNGAREEDDESPVLPGLLVQSSPSTASSAPISPRSPRPQTPLPAEPMPLAQPVVDVKLDDAAEVVTSSGGECLACSLDEHLGLGLSMITKKHSHDGNCTRDASANGAKRRRRGARKNKNAAASNAGSMPPSAVSSPRPLVMTSLPPHLGLGADHLEDLALDTQHLAREISRTRRAPSVVSTQPRQRSTSRSRSRAPSVPPHHVSVIPPPLPSMPSFTSSDASTLTPGSDLPELNFSTPSLPPTVAAAQITKKSSKWNMNMFSSWRDRDSNEEAATERATSLLKGLESTHHTPPASVHSGQRSQTSSSSSQFSHHSHTTSFTAPSVSTPSSTTTTIAFSPPPLPASLLQQQQPAPAVESELAWRGRPQQQQQARWGPSSPLQGAPVRSGLNDRWDRSPASSVYSSRSTATTVPTWRSQGTSVPASAASSMYNGSAPSSSASSTFTRFRNGSEMSFSTTATTVSASSVFNAGGAAGVLGQQEKKKAQPPPSVRAPPSVKSIPPPAAKSQRPPVNVKQMSGIPWELDELPRNMFKPVNGKLPTGDIHGAPPQRRNKAVAPQALATINERPKGSQSRRAQSPGGESAESDGSGTPTEPQSRQQQQQQKKVQKAQINTLAKILTSFKAKRD